jgi:hypothetical protein
MWERKDFRRKGLGPHPALEPIVVFDVLQGDQSVGPMSSRENSLTLSWARNTGQGSALIVLSFIASAILATGALVITSGDGAQAARELVARFSTLVFVISLLVAPLASLFPVRPLLAAARMRGNLRLSFVTAFVFSLACALLPASVAGQAFPGSAALYVGLNSVVLFVMLFPTNRTAMELVGAPSWRAIQLIATAYFWISFLVSALIHLVRDDGSTVWYPLVLMLLIATLVAMAAARFFPRAIR